MNLDPLTCYRALTARDPRFDGVFFVAVTSTRIYCRPVCPARTPGLERCRFFPSAAAAEQARFRPCLRCRPELAPGNAPIDAVGRMASLAASRIGETIGDEDASLEVLAAGLGIGSRHLRRILQRALGVSPVELAQTHRLLLAKQLLTETSLPITQVAFASGFSSVRRFNALFRDRYRLTPSHLRKSNREESPGESIRLTLSYRPPFAWEELLRFLAARAMTGVEAIVGRTYLRTVVLGNLRGWLKVEPVPGRNALAVELPLGLTGALPQILSRLRILFDLDARPDVIASHLCSDRNLGESILNKPGLRVAGTFDGFELAVRVILGQQVSVRAATTLAGRFAETFGEPIDAPFPVLTRLTPSPARVADALLAELTGIGLVAARAECVRTLARAVCDEEVSLEAGRDPEACIGRLTALPGIGPWTAHYIAMRALRWPDAFPHSDQGLKEALGGRSPSEVLGLAEAWRPWRAYAAMHLWEGLAVGKVEPGRDELPATPISRVVDRRHHGPSGRLNGEILAVKYACKVIDSPVGGLKLVASDAGLAAILWEHDDPKRVPLDACEEAPEHPVLVEAQRQLREYFEGKRTAFSLALDFKGTEFQKRVWEALLTIPCGETRSYGQIAGQIGNARALRAVGAAIGKNPISIIAPCHRVVGSTGKLTGFAGGLEVKERLLTLESASKR